jgi:hypothetical protein
MKENIVFFRVLRMKMGILDGVVGGLQKKQLKQG